LAELKKEPIRDDGNRGLELPAIMGPGQKRREKTHLTRKLKRERGKYA